MDTRRRDLVRRTGPLGTSNLAHHRHTDSRTTLRALASRNRAAHTRSHSHGVRHVAPIGSHHHRSGRHHHHRRRHVRPVFGYHVGGFDWDYYWQRHHNHRVRPSRGVVIVHPQPYYPDPYYGGYVPPSPGFQDDHRYEEYIEEEYGVVPAPHAPTYPPSYESPYELPEPYVSAPDSAAKPAEGQPSPTDIAYGRAVEAFTAGDYAASRTHLREVVRIDRDDGEAWMALLQVSFLLGDFNEAAQALGEAARLNAFPRGYRFDPRPMFKDPAVFDAALTKLHTESSRYPRRVNAWLVRAYFHVALGEHEAATSAIHHVLVLRPRDPTAPVLHTALLPPAETTAPATR